MKKYTTETLEALTCASSFAWLLKGKYYPLSNLCSMFQRGSLQRGGLHRGNLQRGGLHE